uniref:PID domain-containing protein n=1 Tax=Schistocephalus solidus TaxID=70667 RepID=A0A183SWL3_SCHSO
LSRNTKIEEKVAQRISQASQAFGQLQALCGITTKPKFDDIELVNHILHLCAQAKQRKVVISASLRSLRLISAENKVIGRLDWSQGVQAHKLDATTSTFVLYTESTEQKKFDCFIIRLLEPSTEISLYSDLVRWQLDSVLQKYNSNKEALRRQQSAEEWRKGRNICKFETVSQKVPVSEDVLGLNWIAKRRPLIRSNRASGSEDATSDALSVMSTNVPSVRNSLNRLPRMAVLRGDFDQDYIKQVGEKLGRRAYGPKI